MPELPDIDAYCVALERTLLGCTLHRVRLGSPFLCRTVSPSPSESVGKSLTSVRRVGKRVVLEFGEGVFWVVHLMIAGRFRWQPPRAKLPKKLGLLALDFDQGTLILTEAGSKRRASLHIVQGEAELAALDPGGIEPLSCTEAAFIAALRAHNHTVKRALTDPKILSGIGNAYSDEILFDARLSPFRPTGKMTDDELAGLHRSVVSVLTQWRDRFVAETADGFPTQVTAFRPEMTVHGRYGEPCRVCGTKVQRVRFTSRELNYCARCQTGGKLLSDRSLSRLLKGDWQRTLDD